VHAGAAGQAGQAGAEPGQGPGWGVQGDHEQPGGYKQQGDLGAGDRSDHADHQGDGPQAPVAAVGEAGELDRGQRDDRHDRGRHPIEQRLDDRQALGVDVDDRDRQHGHKRGDDERGGHRQGAERAAGEEADPHGDLGGQRAGHGLAERDAVEEVLAAEPAAAFDQVALHVADGGDGAAEAPGAKAEEVAEHRPQPERWLVGRLLWLGRWDGRLGGCRRGRVGLPGRVAVAG
jgi:hypothetical protein